MRRLLCWVGGWVGSLAQMWAFLAGDCWRSLVLGFTSLPNDKWHVQFYNTGRLPVISTTLAYLNFLVFQRSIDMQRLTLVIRLYLQEVHRWDATVLLSVPLASVSLLFASLVSLPLCALPYAGSLLPRLLSLSALLGKEEVLKVTSLLWQTTNTNKTQLFS